ncbi:UAP56-interacting factor [Rhinatrema bivittatum]|uniref:UAP56-interacting factor n=1 Tax=Rhinatrema bivittatum TaxID=194408 RepID=UPI0011264414|nr:UAP56-interacting factor [Rhinatrema bivittatum]
MSGFGFGFGAGGESSESPDKLDMSLDDIIKLNREEERKLNMPRQNGGLRPYFTRQFRRGRRRWGIQQQKGVGRNRLGYRGRIMGKKRSYGLITGLAARKASVMHKGISPLNRPPLSERNIQRQRPMFKRGLNLPRSSEFQRIPAAGLRRPFPWSNSIPGNIDNNDFFLNHQRDTRQATFLFRRGLKVQAQLQSEQQLEEPALKRSRLWRTSSTSGGILTISIDNPAAINTPLPARSRLTHPLLPAFLMKKDSSEPRIPKGVALQFDINSVGKQTGITLNERFRILKEQRSSLMSEKGSRFVTVG